MLNRKTSTSEGPELERVWHRCSVNIYCINRKINTIIWAGPRCYGRKQERH